MCNAPPPPNQSSGCPSTEEAWPQGGPPGALDAMTPLATYKLPTFLCQQSCDQNSLCTAFVMDAAQANCGLLQNPNVASRLCPTYWKVNGGA